MATIRAKEEGQKTQMYAFVFLDDQGGIPLREFADRETGEKELVGYADLYVGPGDLLKGENLIQMYRHPREKSAREQAYDSKVLAEKKNLSQQEREALSSPVKWTSQYRFAGDDLQALLGSAQGAEIVTYGNGSQVALVPLEADVKQTFRPVLDENGKPVMGKNGKPRWGQFGNEPVKGTIEASEEVITADMHHKAVQYGRDNRAAGNTPFTFAQENGLVPEVQQEAESATVSVSINVEEVDNEAPDYINDYEPSDKRDYDESPPREDDEPAPREDSKSGLNDHFDSLRQQVANEEDITISQESVTQEGEDAAYEGDDVTQVMEDEEVSEVVSKNAGNPKGAAIAKHRAIQKNIKAKEAREAQEKAEHNEKLRKIIAGKKAREKAMKNKAKGTDGPDM